MNSGRNYSWAYTWYLSFQFS